MISKIDIISKDNLAKDIQDLFAHLPCAFLSLTPGPSPFGSTKTTPAASTVETTIHSFRPYITHRYSRPTVLSYPKENRKPIAERIVMVQRKKE